jgi:hypothetical protein
MGALGDSYASPGDLELRLNQTDNGTFGTLLDAASRAVESFTHRQFNMTEYATARRFRAADWERLPVDDFHTTDDLVIEVKGVALTADQYDLRPWDGVVDGQTGWPYFDVFRVGGYWPSDRRARVEVTAQWGWEAVPQAIREATLDVAVVMFYGVGGGSGPVRSEAIDGYSVSYQTLQMSTAGASVPPEMVKAAPYRRTRFGVA